MTTRKTDQSDYLLPRSTLRLLSYNIQLGIPARRYRDYVMHSWKHLLPYRNRHHNLSRIAHMIKGFDIVGLQELDSGSIRSGFVNHAEFLANKAGFPHWYDKTNRHWGKVARHSMGVLSKYASTGIQKYNLPGRVSGRGALIVHFGDRHDPLALVLAHLSLSRNARKQQIEFMCELVKEYNHVILMGDLNCGADSEEIEMLLEKTTLTMPYSDLLTYPSWNPRIHLDHILISKSIGIHDVKVLEYPLSDHLPIAMEVSVPQHVFMPKKAA
jgi:endonuclease/exonuclease/phosphatase family metal-dependent hydrolase